MANRYDDEHRFRPDLMAPRPFDSPYSLPGLRACKADEVLGGQAAHWDLFDRIQQAHLIECRNVAAETVLRECAADVGLNVQVWEEAYRSQTVLDAVRADLSRARERGVWAVPTLFAAGEYVLSGARSEAQYEAWLHAVEKRLARTPQER